MNLICRSCLLACCSALLATGCRTPGPFAAAGANPLGLSSDDRARQAKLQPVIECINNALAHFQELQPQYRRRLAAVTKHMDEGPAPTYISFKVAPYEQNGQFSRDCAAGLKKAAALPPSIPDIDGPAKDAAQALVGLIQPGSDMEAYFSQQAYLTDQGSQRARDLDVMVGPLLDRVVQDADALEAAVQQQETGLRQRELEAIETKYGRNLTWHTRHCMMVARTMNENLSRLARNRQLTVKSVAQAEQPLQDAYDQGSAWVRAHPSAGTPNRNGSTPMWFQIKDELSHELGDVNELQQVLSTPQVDAENVRDRLFETNSEFDQMVQTYNQELQNNVSTD